MDVAQFRTILWLRWRLVVNQWTRGGGLAAVVATLLSVGAILLALAAFGMGLVVGSSALSKASPDLLLIVWDVVVLVFLFFWTIGIASELQRSEIIDLPRLMHLPVSLRDAFLINYVASHVTLSLVIVAPAMAGLIVGLVVGRGVSFAVLALPAFGLLFAVTAWTYCLRGWLAGLMINARRKRAILVWVTIGIMLIAQAPNLYFNLVRAPEAAPVTWTGQAELPPGLETAHRVLPPLWVGYSARELMGRGDFLPSFLTGAALFGLAFAGFRQAYRGTARFYSGTTRRRKEREVQAAAEESVGALERRWPGVSEPVSAVAAASLRSILRAPELKMALGSAVAMVLVFGVIFLRPGLGAELGAARPWALFGAINLALMIANQLYANQFGSDRDGFRTYVLSPISGRDLLLGKNLVMLPLLLAVVWLLLGALALVWRMPVLLLVQALMQGASASVVVLGMGNVSSIFLPYHTSPGTLKPSRTKPHVMVALIGFTFVLPLVLLPVAAPTLIESILTLTGNGPSWPVGLIGSGVVLLTVSVFYWLSLAPLGRVLERRKLQILTAVTRAVE
ncbi:MAG: hypothetical protein WA771_09235 [Chthoniobacterales bacterium]